MSFSRPDPSSPASIADATFGTSRRGFDQAEVKDFLRMVAAEFGRLSERERFLERELQVAQSNPDLSSSEIDDEAMTRRLGEEAIRVLTTARESGNAIRDKAEQAASRLLLEASDEASRIRQEADIEGSRRRADATNDAEAELAMAKQQGREMVNEARAYRERVLSELARRRELAREQIEQLIHGRDRLMQAFERARLVAVDVVSEMQPLGEPDEYVNLAPTTGPLPVMIANSPRPEDSMSVEDTHEIVNDDGDATEAVPVTQHELRVVEDGHVAEQVHADGADANDVAVIEATDDTVADGAAADGTVADIEVADTEGSDADAGIDAQADTDDDVEAAAESEQSNNDDDDDDVVVDLFARLRADADDDVVDAEVDEPTVSSVADVLSMGEADEAVAEADEDLGEPTPFELRDEVLTPLIVASAKKLRRVLADEQNGVLDALRRTEDVHDLEALLPDAGEHASRYCGAIEQELLEAVHAGSATSRTINRKIRKALATESVNAANDVVEQWLVTPLRDRLAQCISDGSGDNPAITKKVRAVYREWKTRHIDETLDDVLRAAHGRGVLAGFDVDTPIVWEVDQRLAACPDCEDNALAGAVAAGDEFPTGHAFAPAHQGCRCLLAAADR